MYFSAEQTDFLNQATRGVERRTGVQIVAAVVDKSDAYPEIPWKAFALGSVSTALVLWIGQVVQPDALTPHARLAPMLGAGVTAALMTVFWPAFARLFLDEPRAAAEVEQHARTFFLEREIYNTPDRTGILLLVSLFEHRVIILPDRGVVGRLEAPMLQPVVERITALLKQGRRFAALGEGLSLLRETLEAAGFSADGRGANPLPEDLIQRREGRP